MGNANSEDRSNKQDTASVGAGRPIPAPRPGGTTMRGGCRRGSVGSLSPACLPDLRGEGLIAADGHSYCPRRRHGRGSLWRSGSLAPLTARLGAVRPTLSALLCRPALCAARPTAGADGKHAAPPDGHGGLQWRPSSRPGASGATRPPPWYTSAPFACDVVHSRSAPSVRGGRERSRKTDVMDQRPMATS